jgi:hypothetical protein
MLLKKYSLWILIDGVRTTVYFFEQKNVTLTASTKNWKELYVWRALEVVVKEICEKFTV